jgi:hypothetical protein
VSTLCQVHNLALAQACAFVSPFLRSKRAIGMLRQFPATSLTGTACAVRVSPLTRWAKFAK